MSVDVDGFYLGKKHIGRTITEAVDWLEGESTSEEHIEIEIQEELKNDG